MLFLCNTVAIFEKDFVPVTKSQVGKKQGLRLDYFLANHTAKKMIKTCEIDMGPRMAEKPTDHCGLMIKLD